MAMLNQSYVTYPPGRGYVRRRKSMFPGKFMWQLKVTRVSVLSLKSVLTLLVVGASASSSSMLPSSLLLEKKRVVGHVSGEGLAPIVSAYSRLILVDGTVL
jgi:hypothetical protein